MANLCADIGYKSILHDGEQLCGDHVDIIEAADGSNVVVLADGLGSGVKASILSTLTSKIISTMIAEGLQLDDCVEAIASTLPIDAKKNVAYSTFTIIHVSKDNTAVVIQYDNPPVILLRNGKNHAYPKKELEIHGKKILRTKIRLHEKDILIAMSDGCPHASIGLSYNFNWQLSDIISFMEGFSHVGYAAKTLATILIDEVNKQYGYKPIDDATAVVVQICQQKQVNVLFGPPSAAYDAERMMSSFFGLDGKYIVCGGTTASIAADYLGQKITFHNKSEAPDVPPISEIPGVDLVTEGIVTMNKVVAYAKDHLDSDELYVEWGFQRDGASLICRLLFEEATDINLYVGRAINPAHQEAGMTFNFNYKMELVRQLENALKEMGKRVKVTYF